MEAKRTATALVLLLCTTFLLWLVATAYDVGGARTNPEAASSYTVVIYHSVRNGEHVYAGALESTGCETLSTGVRTENGEPAKLTVDLRRIASTSCSAEMKAKTGEEPFLIAIDTQGGVPRIEQVTIDGISTTFTVLED